MAGFATKIADCLFEVTVFVFVIFPAASPACFFGCEVAFEVDCRSPPPEAGLQPRVPAEVGHLFPWVASSPLHSKFLIASMSHLRVASSPRAISSLAPGSLVRSNTTEPENDAMLNAPPVFTKVQEQPTKRERPTYSWAKTKEKKGTKVDYTIRTDSSSSSSSS